jgi:hypothetical protein
MLFFMLASSNHACNVIATGLWWLVLDPWMDRDSEEPSYIYISSEMKCHAIGALPLHALIISVV